MKQTDEKARAGFESYEKGELHAHLNGCIPPEVTKELVVRHGVEVPEDFDIELDLQILEPVSSLVEYFKPWLLLKRLPIGKECLLRMVDAAVETTRRDGVKYVEFRNSPFNICEINNVGLEEALEWLIEGLRASSLKHGVDAKLVVSLSRHNLELEKARKLLNAIRSRDCERLIVGVDMSGDENAEINDEVTRFFRRAKEDLGLGVSIHAGETGVAENILWAVDECGADRVGHALAAANSRKIMDRLREKNVCVEVSMISNLRTGSVKCIDEHPVTVFIENEVPFVLCSDNPQVHRSSLSDEYALFSKLTARLDLIETMYGRQMEFCFGAGSGNEQDT